MEYQLMVVGDAATFDSNSFAKSLSQVLNVSDASLNVTRILPGMDISMAITTEVATQLNALVTSGSVAISKLGVIKSEWVKDGIETYFLNPNVTSTQLAIMCTPNPCKSGGSCVVQQDEFDFICECPTAFAGDFCEFTFSLNVEGIVTMFKPAEFSSRFAGALGEEIEYVYIKNITSGPGDTVTLYIAIPTDAAYKAVNLIDAGDQSMVDLRVISADKDGDITVNKHISICTPNPCDNNGTCSSEVVGQPKCTCVDPFTGDSCSVVYTALVVGDVSTFDEFGFVRGLATAIKVATTEVRVYGISPGVVVSLLVPSAGVELINQYVKDGHVSMNDLEVLKVTQKVGNITTSFLNPNVTWQQINSVCEPTPCINSGKCVVDWEKYDFACNCSGNWTGDDCGFTFTVGLSSSFESFNSERFRSQLATDLNEDPSNIGVLDVRANPLRVQMNILTLPSETMKSLVAVGDVRMVSLDVIYVEKNGARTSTPQAQMCQSYKCENGGSCYTTDKSCANGTTFQVPACACMVPYTGDNCSFTYELTVVFDADTFLNESLFVSKLALALDVDAVDINITSYIPGSRMQMGVSDSTASVLNTHISRGDVALVNLGVLKAEYKDQYETKVYRNPKSTKFQIEKLCSPNPCLYDGSCTLDRTKVAYICNCTPPHTGDYCELDVKITVVGDLLIFNSVEFESALSFGIGDHVAILNYTQGSIVVQLGLTSNTARILMDTVSVGGKNMTGMGVLSININGNITYNPDIKTVEMVPGIEIDGTSSDSKGALIGILVGVVVLATSLVAMAYYMYLRCRKIKKAKETQNSIEKSTSSENGHTTEEFLSHQINQPASPVSIPKSKIGGKWHTKANISNSSLLSQDMRRIPRFSSNIENQLRQPTAIALRERMRVRKGTIPAEALQRHELLGGGAFGLVYSGELKDNDHVCPVAIKELRPTGDDEINKFIAESELMKKLHHTNIVQCLGVATGPPLAIVLELMTIGDLWTYLRTQDLRESYVTVAERHYTIFQISRAMRYLSANGVVHRDLAARNCMMSGPEPGSFGFPVVRVSDFGLSRQVLRGENYYKMQSSERVPIAWMPPEAIKGKRFSEASDVWSFGVVSWEVFEDAREKPYHDQNVFTLVSFLNRGNRLLKPSKCSEESYTIMKCCWIEEPSRRPTFETLTNALAQQFAEVSPIDVCVERDDNYDIVINRLQPAIDTHQKSEDTSDRPEYEILSDNEGVNVRECTNENNAINIANSDRLPADWDGYYDADMSIPELDGLNPHPCSVPSLHKYTANHPIATPPTGVFQSQMSERKCDRNSASETNGESGYETIAPVCVSGLLGCHGNRDQ
eukprot:CFRG2686T1